jgi:flagellar basal-body rod protein FlgC
MPDSGMFRGVDACASAMHAEKLRMSIAAENLAHAGDTHRLANGLPYARQRVYFQNTLDEHGNATGSIDARVVKMPAYTSRYDPTHPDADAKGWVTEPEINPVLELTDLMVASRAFDASSGAVHGLLHANETALHLADP